MELPNPSDLLEKMYRDSGQDYHNRDFIRVFPEFDTDALKEYFFRV